MATAADIAVATDVVALEGGEAAALGGEAIGLAPDLPLIPPLEPADTMGWLRSLAAAILLHAGVLAWLNWPVRDNAIGGGGTELEAISVDLVKASAIESILETATSELTASQPKLAEREGKERQQEAVAEAPDLKQQRAPDAAARPERADLVIPDTVVKPEPTPPDAPALVIAPTSSEAKVEAPDPPREIAAPPGTAVATAASSPSEAVSAEIQGGAAARGVSVMEMATQSAALALTGELAAFARQVQQAVARNPPKVPRGGPLARGDVVITFALGLDGTLLRADVLSSSGSAALDAVALTTVRSTKFPVPPAGSQPSQLVYKFPVRFR